MATKNRKSNKTAHVLNLLSSNEPDETVGEAVEAAIETDPDEVPSAQTPPAIPIIDSLGNTGDPLDSVIQNSLELELAAAAPEKPRGYVPGFMPSGFVPPEPAPAKTPAIQQTAPLADSTPAAQTQATPVMDTAPAQPQAPPPQTQAAPVMDTAPAPAAQPQAAPPQTQAAPVMDTTPAAQPQAPQTQAAPVMDTTPTPAAQPQVAPPQAQATRVMDTTPAPAAQPQASPPPAQTVPVPDIPPKEIPPEKPESTYSYTNVMEYLVEDRVLESMKTFNMCTCDRCKVDVTALALTALLPKYIVVDRDFTSPLLNFYANKYSIDMMTQLTKACGIVKDRPRH